jgi:hypothetical protein
MAFNNVSYKLTYNLFSFLSMLFVINAIGIIVLGLIILGEAWVGIFEYGLGSEQRPGVHIFEGLDIILIGIVFLIFGISIKAFIKKPAHTDELENKQIHQLFDAETFGKQKRLLWQTFLTTLLFAFLSQVFREEVLDWELLVIPISTLLLAAAFFFSNKVH